MGLFSGFFGSSSGIERQLEDQYVPMFKEMMKVTSSQAKNTLRDMLKQIKEESLKEGTANLPQNYGDDLIKKESTDEKTKAILAKKREEGVRDDDIRWWWNIHDLERRMMLKVDELNRMAMFMDCVQKGMGEEAAAIKVRKYHPIYGDPEDTSHTYGEDRPLPHELKDRINIYIEKRMHEPERYKKEIKESSTFNSLIRE